MNLMKYEEIQEKLKVLINSKPKPIPDAEMEKFRKKIAEKCPKSKKQYEDFKNSIAGGTQHQLALKDPFCVTMKRCQGTRMWDIDDNEYIDWLMCAGACLLGHNNPALRQELVGVHQDLDPNIYWNTEWKLKAAELIKKHVPSIELLQYFQSGTEADMAAIRLARVFTGNEKIIKIGGGYHGWSDQLTYDMHVPYSGNMESHGIPKGCYKNTVAVPPNDLEALEEALKKWSEKRSGVAAIITEPLGPESGAIPLQPGFNEALRELCDKYGVLLIFDEVVTGFRLGLGGAQEHFKIKPDLTIFGKILTHGFPGAGLVGGRKDIMSRFTADVEAGEEHAFIGGTLRANPLTVAATYWTIKLIEQHDAIDKAAKMGDDLVKKLNDLFESMDLNYFAYNTKSIIHYETYTPVAMDIRKLENIQKAFQRKEYVDRIALALFAKGIITKYGNRAFTCMAHTPEDNDQFVEAFEEVLKLLPK